MTCCASVQCPLVMLPDVSMMKTTYSLSMGMPPMASLFGRDAWSFSRRFISSVIVW